MCYVHNQWYDISCATLYNFQISHPTYKATEKYTGVRDSMLVTVTDSALLQYYR